MADMETEKQQETASSAQPEKPAKKRMSLATRKKLKYGGIATAITCVVTAVVIGANVLVSNVMEKYPLKLDLTENGMYEISDDSVNYLHDLGQDVNFTVLMSESNFQTSGTTMKMVSELLERYTQYSDKIHLSYVDPSTNPDVVNTYQQNYSGTLQEGDIIVSDANDDSKMRVVNMNSLFSYDQQKLMAARYYGQGTVQDAITGFSGEQNLTAALMYVTDANPIKVGFIQTANESPIYNANYHYYGASMFASTLAKNGYDVQGIDLYKDELDPAVYDVLVLPAPVNDLTATAIDSISAFLYNDGEYNRNLIYIADFTQGDTPKLDELLSTWGIEVTKNLALEGDSKAAQQVTLAIGNASVPLATIANEDYAAGMANASLPIVAPLCRPINLLWESQTGGITSALLQTSETVYLNEMGQKTENADTTPAGTQTVAAMTTRAEMIDNVKHQSNIMVLGSMMLLDSNVMQDASYNNAPYFINALNLMTGKDTGLVIAEKQLTAQTLSMSTSEMHGAMFAVYFIPAIVVCAGVIVILRRRNK
ncbi:MAG: GldG family protein [Oscillospiraceae bacterium]|nr:GldG family protein [Oscillospiraceae bacterium]